MELSPEYLLLFNALTEAQEQLGEIGMRLELIRQQLAVCGKGAHRLMVEQAKRKLFCSRRLHKTLFDIELHERDPLNEIPRQ